LVPEHVLAGAAAGAGGGGGAAAAALECPEALVLRLSDAGRVGQLRRHMTRSAALVESVAGLMEQEDPSLDPTTASSTTPTTGKTATGTGTGSSSSGLGVTRDLLDELLAHRDVFELSGSLPSLELKLSGRRPRAWRTVRQLAARECTTAAAGGAAAAAAVGAVVELSGSMYQQSESHAGTDVEGGVMTHGPGSTSSASDLTAAAAGSTSTAPRPPSAKSASRGSAAGTSAAAASVGPPPHSRPSSSRLAAAGGGGGGVASEALSGSDAEDEFEDAAEYQHGEEEAASDEEESSNSSIRMEDSASLSDDDDGEEEGDQEQHPNKGAAAAATAKLREISLEQEVPLLAVRLAAAAVQLQYSADRMAVALRMQALQVDDQLMGTALGRQFAVLAVSSSSPSSSSLSPSLSSLPYSGSDVRRTASAEAGAGGVGGASTESLDAPPLVQLSFISNSASSDRYQNLDSELTLHLEGLSLACHRPTVAALMGLGADMAYANSLLAAEKQVGAVQAPPPGAVQGAVQGSTAAAVAAATAAVAAPAAVVRTGGEGRTLMRLRLSMASLQLEMPYEVLQPSSSSAAGEFRVPRGFSEQQQQQQSHSQEQQQQQEGGEELIQADEETGEKAPNRRQLFALGTMDSFNFCLDVRPSSLELTTSLGNFTAQYGSLPYDNPYRTICTLRPGTSTSLIEVAFRMHSAAESLSQPRVPPGSPFYSLTASLSAVQLVYMGRFLNELLPYISGMLAMQPRSRPPTTSPGSDPPPHPSTSSASTSTAPGGHPESIVPPSAAATSADAAGSSSSSPAAAAAAAPPMVLLLDVSLASPVITLPQCSDSGLSLLADLGHLRLQNAVAWRR
ncbi:hypothetical protein Agub_g14843, partial [Astrephomene gubernaculifera]